MRIYTGIETEKGTGYFNAEEIDWKTRAKPAVEYVAAVFAEHKAACPLLSLLSVQQKG